MFNPGNNLAVLFLVLLYTLTTLAAPPLSSTYEEPTHYHGRRMAIGPKYRLPETFEPISYDLTIRPYLDEEEGAERFTALGAVKIDMRLLKTTSPGRNITLNSATIQYNNPQNNIQVTDNNGQMYQVTSFYQNETEQLVNIEVDKEFNTSASVFSVVISYTAPIPNGVETAFGLYRSSYVASDGQTRYLAVTDFESVDARRMAPCFDEPHLKASWTIRVQRKNPYHSISNMPLQDTVPLENGWFQDNYMMSPPMSTYLVALAVSDYASAEADPNILGKPVKAWGPPPMMADPENGGTYAPDFSAKVLKFYGDTLDEIYTLPKMDKLAIPDFSAGAMENWGMNTYRISRLLWFPGNSTVQDKVSLSDTIAHELAHQWFGDLVTMQWWDDLWLNEGFATYWSSVAVNDVHPEYRLAEYFVYDSVQTAMQVDVGSMHPLHYAGLTTPAETRYGFDTISYDKGASILRMTNATLGENLFIQGLKNYLDANTYGNANQDKLFEVLNAVDGVQDALAPVPSVKDFLDTWTLQSGYPLIRVQRSAEDPVKITVSQEHYKDSNSERKWHVPITWYESIRKEGKFWLLNTNKETEIPNFDATAGQYLIVNPEQRGYYRVLYDDTSFNAIQQVLMTNPQLLHEQTRSAFLDDNFNLAYDGYQDLTKALVLSTYLSNETQLTPWASFARNMAKPYSLLRSTGAFYCFRKYIRSIVEPNLVAIGFEPVDTEEIGNGKLLRNRLFEWACNVEHPACLSQSRDWVTAWRTAGQKPQALVTQPDLRPFAYCAAMASAADKEATFNFLYQEYQKSDRETDQLSLLRGLACSKDTYLLTRLIQLATDSSSAIRNSQRVTALQAVAGNTLGSQIIFNSLRDSVDGIIEAWGPSVITSVISTLSSSFATEVKHQDLQRFITANKDKLCPTNPDACLSANLNTVQANIEWMNKHYATLSSFANSNCG